MHGNGGRRRCSPSMSPRRESMPGGRGTSRACGHSRHPGPPRVWLRCAVPDTRSSTQWTCNVGTKKNPPMEKEGGMDQSMVIKERVEGERGLCVFAETLFGQHVWVRKPRKDHVERLAEERRCELRSRWSCRISIGLRSCVQRMTDRRLTSSRRPPLMRGSAHP
jgi:hypothetical protein